MKKKTLLILICLAAYCYLFYQQTIGINFLVFNVFMITGLLVIDTTLIKHRSWLFVAVGAIITSVSACLYGSVLSYIGNVISLLLLANLSLEKEASLFFSFLQVCFSYIAVPFVRLAGLVDRMMSREEEAKPLGITFSNVLKFTIPAVVLLVFFFLYRNSSAVFSSFIDSISIEISWGFIGFLLVGFYLISIFFNQYSFVPLIQTDRKFGNTLTGENTREKSLFGSVEVEFSSAVITFSLLNLLLLFVNILDIQFILSDSAYKAHEYSRYIHQGVNSSIFSVLVAILVTLYFFRGNLNFFSKSRLLRILAIIWIILNMVLLFTCAHKNFSYIYEYGLTHKRIGVYFYLLITCIGLLTTWIKITSFKSNLFLVRSNTWSVFVVLVVSTTVNWNRLIVEHNSAYQPSIDYTYYYYNVPEASLPLLMKNYGSLTSRIDGEGNDVKDLVKRKAHGFIKRYEKMDWQSWNLEDQRIYSEIKAME